MLGQRIMQGNEEAWVDMMLEDVSFLKSIGITHIPSLKEKGEIKKILLGELKQESSQETSFNKEDYKATDVVTKHDLQEGSLYEMSFPNGDVTICTFMNKMTYPSSGMPSDYLFRWVSGKRFQNKDDFPIPDMLMAHTTLKKVHK